jgi:hypothetical protein
MKRFPDSFRIRGAVLRIKAQRDPATYMGLERMMLKWMSVMGFVVSTSLLLAPLPGTAPRFFQYFFLPFAMMGLIYSVFRYYSRLHSINALDASNDTPVGSDPLVYMGMVLLILGITLSVFVITWLQFY